MSQWRSIRLRSMPPLLRRSNSTTRDSGKAPSSLTHKGLHISSIVPPCWVEENALFCGVGICIHTSLCSFPEPAQAALHINAVYIRSRNHFDHFLGRFTACRFSHNDILSWVVAESWFSMLLKDIQTLFEHDLGKFRIQTMLDAPFLNQTNTIHWNDDVMYARRDNVFV